MVWKERRLRMLASVFLLPAIAATPAPGNVILDVEANIIGKSSFPCFLHSSMIFNNWSGVSVMLCTQYALSQKILKSFAAGFSAAKRRTVSSEYVMP